MLEYVLGGVKEDMTILPQITIDPSSLPDQVENSGKLKISDVFGEQLIYRSLEPINRKLKGLKKSAGKMDLRNEGIPRKDEEDYARASMWFLNQSQKQITKPQMLQNRL